MEFLNTIFGWARNTSWKQRVVVLFVLGVGWWWFFMRGGEEGSVYKFAVVERGKVENLVSESGEVTSSGVTEVKSSINGVVGEVLVENGDMVVKGDMLFMVISSADEMERSAAYAAYLSAKSSLESAEAKLNSLQSSAFKANQVLINDAVERGLVEGDPTYIQQWADWRQAELDYINQTTVINQAKASVSKAWLDYQAASSGAVKATVSGKVVNLSMAPGQQVSTETSALLIRSEDEQMWVKIMITENDVVEVNSDQPARIRVDSIKGKEFSGRVVRVDEVGAVESGVVTYGLYLRLDDDQDMSGVRPAMTVNVDILTDEKEGVLLVPNAAIKPYQGEKAVQIMDEMSGQVVYKPVLVGVAGTTVTEVVSGLEEGERVIVGENGGGSVSNSGGGGFVFSRPPR